MHPRFDEWEVENANKDPRFDELPEGSHRLRQEWMSHQWRWMRGSKNQTGLLTNKLETVKEMSHRGKHHLVSRTRMMRTYAR